jgi:hypothetical protein
MTQPYPNFEETAPQPQSIQPAFVDALWMQLEAAIKPEAERNLVKFLRWQKATKWIIAADFCIRDEFRPIDSFAFVLLPAGDRYRQTTDILDKITPFDLKDVRSIPRSLKRPLTNGRVFTFCFAADRDRRLYADANAARLCLDQTIEMMEQWENADLCRETIESVRAMRAEASKKSVSLRLLEDITVTAAITASNSKSELFSGFIRFLVFGASLAEW